MIYHLVTLQSLGYLGSARLRRDGLEGEYSSSTMFSRNLQSLFSVGASYLQVIVMNAEEAEERGVRDLGDLEDTFPGLQQEVKKFFRIYKVGRVQNTQSHRSSMVCSVKKV